MLARLATAQANAPSCLLLGGASLVRFWRSQRMACHVPSGAALLRERMQEHIIDSSILLQVCDAIRLLA